MSSETTDQEKISLEVVNNLIAKVEGVISEATDVLDGLKKAKEELEESVPKSSEERQPAPMVADNVVLIGLGLSTKTLRVLREHNISKLLDLARCRKGDLSTLSGFKGKSMDEVIAVLKDSELELKEGKSYIDILKLRMTCATMVSHGDLEEHGNIIGYVAGTISKGEPKFGEFPKFYFRAFDEMVLFLREGNVSDPEKRIESEGFPSF